MDSDISLSKIGFDLIPSHQWSCNGLYRWCGVVEFLVPKWSKSLISMFFMGCMSRLCCSWSPFAWLLDLRKYSLFKQSADRIHYQKRETPVTMKRAYLAGTSYFCPKLVKAKSFIPGMFFSYWCTQAVEMFCSCTAMWSVGKDLIVPDNDTHWSRY